jgi:hypothetical protein
MVCWPLPTGHLIPPIETLSSVYYIGDLLCASASIRWRRTQNQHPLLFHAGSVIYTTCVPFVKRCRAQLVVVANRATNS